ncbi:C-C motif chemokine 28-like [Heterodontus francisci]|uniref:C-C motif chemokine 28-like n=1 Tax=Heterodontus francisci TaxID=7792 RepID=UPI00355C9247
MQLKLAVLLLIAVTALLHVAAVIPQSRVINCCTQVSNKVHAGLLRRVKSFQVQDDQICNIKAVMLHIAHRKLCMYPNNALLKKWMARHMKKEIHWRR